MDRKTNASFMILTHTITKAESLVKIDQVVAEIFDGICQFVSIFGAVFAKKIP